MWKKIEKESYREGRDQPAREGIRQEKLRNRTAPLRCTSCVHCAPRKITESGPRSWLPTPPEAFHRDAPLPTSRRLGTAAVQSPRPPRVSSVTAPSSRQNVEISLADFDARCGWLRFISSEVSTSEFCLVPGSPSCFAGSAKDVH